jgi:hypothetical protein
MFLKFIKLLVLSSSIDVYRYSFSADLPFMVTKCPSLIFVELVPIRII